jgi:hypothetical protein
MGVLDLHLLASSLLGSGEQAARLTGAWALPTLCPCCRVSFQQPLHAMCSVRGGPTPPGDACTCCTLCNTWLGVQEGRTPLHSAAYNGDLEVGTMLLRDGACITAPDVVSRSTTRNCMLCRREHKHKPQTRQFLAVLRRTESGLEQVALQHLQRLWEQAVCPITGAGSRPLQHYMPLSATCCPPGPPMRHAALAESDRWPAPCPTVAAVGSEARTRHASDDGLITGRSHPAHATWR